MHDRAARVDAISMFLASLLVVLGCTTALLLAMSGVANAHPCGIYQGTGNMGVVAGSDTSGADGVRGTIKIDYDRIVQINGTYVTSLYVYHDGNDFVEFGFSIVHGLVFTERRMIDARMFAGVYALREHDPPSEDFHAFKIQYDTSEDRYDFYYEGVSQPYHRDPTWRLGLPLGVMETKDHCDEGNSSFQGLDYRQSLSWSPWSPSDWFNDTEPNWGYDYVSSTKFTTSARSDDYIGCNTAMDSNIWC